MEGEGAWSDRGPAASLLRRRGRTFPFSSIGARLIAADFLDAFAMIGGVRPTITVLFGNVYCGCLRQMSIEALNTLADPRTRTILAKPPAGLTDISDATILTIEFYRFSNAVFGPRRSRGNRLAGRGFEFNTSARHRGDCLLKGMRHLE